MYDDPCPKCGHRKKQQLMSTNHEYDDLTLTDMWNGGGEWWQAALLKAFALFIVFIVACVVIAAAL